MFNARRLALGLVLLSAAGGSWWLTRSAAPPPAGAAPPPDQPDYVIEKFTARALNSEGTDKYVLSAQRLTHYPAGDTAYLVEPVLVQYLPHGAIVTTRADSGVMPGDGREILMRGNVRVRRSGDTKSAGGEITAEQLRVELQ